jgi:hypothetical protein
MLKLTQSKIKLEFMWMCIRGNSFAPVSTSLLLYIAAVLLNRLMLSENYSVLFDSNLYQIYNLFS